VSELIDNRAFRLRTLKGIIQHLNQGGAPEEARRRLKELVREVDCQLKETCKLCLSIN